MSSDRYLIKTAELNARALATERLAAARERHAAAILAEAEALRELGTERLRRLRKPLAVAESRNATVGAA